MADGRTIWWSKDSDWWGRELVVILGEEFGPEGPAVIDWLSCEAKKQNDGGYVKSGPRAIARGCFASTERIPAILSRSVTLGLLDDYIDHGLRFTCRISGWKQDQDRAQAAVRQARSRSSKPETEPLSRSVTAGHAESHTGPEKDLRSSSSAREPANLRERIDQIQAVFADFGQDVDELTVANAVARFPSIDHMAAARGCAEYLRDHPDKPAGHTFHRYLEREQPVAAGRSKEQRAADDMAALERLSDGAA
jgi:hypothetical protein